MKRATVIVSGAPEGQREHEVEIPVGAQAGDILNAIGLEGYLLSRSDSAQPFAQEENIYDAVPEDGMKFNATPIAEVGKKNAQSHHQESV